jgi:thiosulfate/3-mercaptopyruvate sulfurtransferase
MPHRRHVAKLLCATPFLTSAARAAATDAVPATALLEPAELEDMLKGSTPPVALHVGFKTLYDQAHIPGSPYAGPGNSEAGLANLKAQVASVQKDRALVIYCGCCPWVRCPNIAASFEQLHSLGFHNVKAMKIVTNFGQD